ncbi:MAG: hypothetical protein J7M34_01875 [Anaerolineae bacterium]|nr:hypothetical protein [Anaerolineae bacterium]
MHRSSYPTFVVIAALMAGLLIGWLLIGWWLWPVQWTDALPADLAPEHRDVYVIGVAYMFQSTHDLERAQQAIAALGSTEQQSLALAIAMAASPADAQAVRELRQALALPEVSASAASATEGVAWPGLLLRSALIVVLVGLGGLGSLILYNRVREGRVPSPSLPVLPSWRLPRVQLPPPQARHLGDRLWAWIREALPTGWRWRTTASSESTGAPGQIGVFTPTYRQGIVDYAESYNLYMPDTHEYLGECGLGVRKSLGKQDPRAIALEVWLFDKKDILSRACVLLSQHAYEDPAIYEELSQNDLVALAHPGETFTIESQSMILTGEVHEVTYVDDEDLPPQSVFKKVEVSLEVHLRE